jgi:hypothetical protein
MLAVLTFLSVAWIWAVLVVDLLRFMASAIDVTQETTYSLSCTAKENHLQRAHIWTNKANPVSGQPHIEGTASTA